VRTYFPSNIQYQLNELTMKNDLLENLKDNFGNLQQADWSKLGDIYATDVLFKDPVHELRGLVLLEDYFSSMCADLTDCRFEYLDQVVSDNSAYLKWEMHFKHPRLGREVIDVRGVSHIRGEDKIDYHEDFYDLGAMLYERLPLIGNVTRWLKLRMAS
jgi:hypothetical protein